MKANKKHVVLFQIQVLFLSAKTLHKIRYFLIASLSVVDAENDEENKRQRSNAYQKREPPVLRDS